MSTQFQYLHQLAQTYHHYVEDQEQLWNALSQLSMDTLRQIYHEQFSTEASSSLQSEFRFGVLQHLQKGKAIREKDLEKLEREIYSVDALQISTDGANRAKHWWKNPWPIFYTFLYRDTTAATCRQYIEQLGHQILRDLDLDDYQFLAADFAGVEREGSTNCRWIFYPRAKARPEFAHQLVLRIGREIEVGHLPAPWSETTSVEALVKVKDYQTAIVQLRKWRTKNLRRNRALRSAYKVAPGEQARQWESYFEEGMIGFEAKHLPSGSWRKYKNYRQFTEAVGLGMEQSSSLLPQAWLFKEARPGDLVFANKGTNTCLGIGVVEGNYQYEKNYPEAHRRRINWLTNKVYHYRAGAWQKQKTLFRPDRFSALGAWEFILQEYARLFPELQEVFDQHQLSYQPRAEQWRDSAWELTGPARSAQFWWLNVNPNVWKISHQSEGAIQLFSTRNERGNKRLIYKNFAALQKGDYVIGYESSPVKRVQAILQVRRGIYQSDREGEVIELELLEKLEVPVHWSEVYNHPGLGDSELLQQKQGTLFHLNEAEFDLIRDLIDTKNIDYEQFLRQNEVRPYRYEEDPDRPFVAPAEMQRMVALLRRKKNLILQGPPGVGKTFIARKLAFELMGNHNNAQIELVQFHQSYSYEDFVQGLRPARGGGFELRNGLFYDFCQRALAHPQQSFFLLIDEINRGNLSKIFGELMMLLEADKRAEKYHLRLTYAEADDAPFFVPPNLYLIGTMNTADRSLAIVDYALRRRFAFVEIQPSFGEAFQGFMTEKGLTKKRLRHISRAVERVNQYIREEVSLGKGFQIGHSYFCTYEAEMEESAWYDGILRYELQPLLDEIWFDDPGMVEKMMEILRY